MAPPSRLLLALLCAKIQRIRGARVAWAPKNQSLLMGRSQGERALLGGPEQVFWDILVN